jgi:PAS domain S-box-containing protein
MGLEEPPPDCPIRRAIEDDRETAYTAACDNGDTFEVTVTPIVLSDGRRAAMCLSKQRPVGVDDIAGSDAVGESGVPPVTPSDDETQLLQKIAELSTHTLDVVLDQMTEGVVMIDTSGRLILSNTAFRTMAGFDQTAEPDTDQVAWTLCPDRKEGTSPAAELAEMAAGHGVSRFETELARQDGERMPIELAVSRVAGEREDETVLMVTVRDLRETNDMKDRLINALNLCQDSVAKVLSLIRPGDPSTINMNHLVSEVFSRHYFAEELRMDNIEVVQRYDPGMVETSGYRNLLQQALANIIKNAREAMARASGGGQLMVLTEASAKTITVRISDNGPGIPEDIQDKVFDLLFPSTAPGKGIGAGLHFAREVIARHDGTIEVKSRPGEGATFIIRLPVRQPQERVDELARDVLPPRRD